MRNEDVHSSLCQLAYSADPNRAYHGKEEPENTKGRVPIARESAVFR